MESALIGEYYPGNQEPHLKLDTTPTIKDDDLKLFIKMTCAKRIDEELHKHNHNQQLVIDAHK